MAEAHGARHRRRSPVARPGAARPPGPAPAPQACARDRRTTDDARSRAPSRSPPPRRTGAGRVTLANGIAAVVSTIATIRRSETQPGTARMAATTWRAAGKGQPAAQQRDQAGCHRRRDERDDDQVHRRRQDRESSERDQDHGQRREPARPARPRGSRRASAGRGPLPRRSIASVVGVAQAISPAVASAESWKPASPTRPGSATRRSITAQPSAAAARPARPDSRARSTTAAIAPARTTDADAPANTTYADDRRHRHHRSPPPAHPPGDRRDRRGDDRDVPAGDRDDVTHAGRRERRRQVAVDPVAQADEDPGREAGLRFGQRGGEGGRGGLPGVLDDVGGIHGARRDLDRARADGADRPDPLEVVAVGRRRSRPDRPVDRRPRPRRRSLDRPAASPRPGCPWSRRDPTGASPSGCRPARPRWPRP